MSNKSTSEFEQQFARHNVGRMSYGKSKTVQLKDIVDGPFPLRTHGKTYTMGKVNMPSTGLYYTTDTPLKQIHQQNHISSENIKYQNATHQPDNRNWKITLDAQSSMNKGGKTQTIHVQNPSVQNGKVVTLKEQQNNAENSNKYRETQKTRQEYAEKNMRGRTADWTAWQEEAKKEKKEKNEKENDSSDGNVEKREGAEKKKEEEGEGKGGGEEEEEEEEVKEENEEEDEEDEDNKFVSIPHVPRKYEQNKIPVIYSKNKNLLFSTKKIQQEANVGNKVKNDTDNNNNNNNNSNTKRNQSKEKEESNNKVQKKKAKSVSIQLDTENWIYSTAPSSSTTSTLSYRKTKPNKKTIRQIIRSKLRKVKIILKFLYICRKNINSILNTGRPHIYANKTKNTYNKAIRVQGPFLLKKEREKQTPIRKLGYIPKHLKRCLKDSSAQNKTTNKNKKFVLKKVINTNVYQLFQNMVAIDTLGRLQRWDGYNWNPIHVPFYHFTSVHTNSKGHLLCIDQNYNPGYLMENKFFKKVQTWYGNCLSQIVIDQNNKIWGLHLSGELIKWNKYNWMKIKKAYGISKIKFIAADRKNHLWLLDSNNYLFSYDTLNKSWTHENVSGQNIKYFDFDENNYLVAVTHNGSIKIHKRRKWIHYGMLGQLKICGVHFIREMDSASSIVKTKNEKK